MRSGWLHFPVIYAFCFYPLCSATGPLSVVLSLRRRMQLYFVLTPTHQRCQHQTTRHAGLELPTRRPFWAVPEVSIAPLRSGMLVAAASRLSACVTPQRFEQESAKTLRNSAVINHHRTIPVVKISWLQYKKCSRSDVGLPKKLSLIFGNATLVCRKCFRRYCWLFITTVYMQPQHFLYLTPTFLPQLRHNRMKAQASARRCYRNIQQATPNSLCCDTQQPLLRVWNQEKLLNFL